MTLLTLVSPVADALALRIVAHNEGAPDSRNAHPYWFTVDGVTGQDPQLNLTPGSVVNVTFVNGGDRLHQLQFGAPINQGTALVAAGREATLVLHVPSNATASLVGYWCSLHRPIGMAGAISIGGAPASKPALSESTRTDLIPFPSAAFVLLALAAVGSWRRP
ncbi:MAG: hypothetical protein ACYDCK_11070 [Thermoplasmatota archaeon]